MTRRTLGIAGGSVVLLVACANILGSDDLKNGDPPPVDAGPDTYRDPCTSAPGPLKPAIADGTTKPALSFALGAIDFGSDFDPPGFNLDHRCTYSIDAGSCVPLTKKVPTGQIDGDGGIDNSAVGVLTNNAFPTNISAGVIDAVKKATWTLLFRLDDYSGSPDDPAVTLHVVAGVNTNDAGAADAATWGVDSLFADGGLGGAPVATSAWVAGNVLRAEFSTLSFVARSTSIGTFFLKLTGAYVIATIGPDGKTLTGALAGRWNVDDATEEIKRLKAPIVGCIGKLLTDSLCRAVDILSAPADDNKTFECDAVSIAFRFTAGAVTFPDDAVDGGPLSAQSCASDTIACQ
ncbi:hypothetical protein BH09MYX1_BH09MYX1_33220 [soil metagenome]